MKKGLILIIFSLMVAGCTTTQKGTTAGAITGAAIGGIVGHQSGHAAEGSAIGAAAGGLGGYVIGDKMKSKFCPVGGKRYDGSLSYCPEHGVELKKVE